MLKIIIKFLTVAFFSTCFAFPVYSATIITAPIDGRPISMEYLNKLSEINGDNVLFPDRDILDMFPLNSNYNRFCKSEEVRKSTEEFVKQNNSEENTVILNTSSYITGGLVGSRCGINYYNYEKGLNDIYNLAKKYPLPKYYINLSMPRTLPETRLNKIWPVSDYRNGIAYYYIKHHEDLENKNYISAKFAKVSPEQIIMEWSYVENKKNEIGYDNLSEWEKDFLTNFNKTCKSYEPYKTFLRDYVRPYSNISDMFAKLIRWQNEGVIDEIIISNDDFQLPNSIVYLNTTADSNWIQKENGSPVKYSFARTYITNGPRSVYRILKDNFGEKYAQNALCGKAENINFIFGTDEVPQMIYARDLSKRTGLSPNINIIMSGKSSDVAKFDVLSIKKLLDNGINFVSVGEKKTDKQFDLYVCDYNNLTLSTSSLKNKMNKSFSENKNIGLIELFNSEVSASGNNDLFKSLSDSATSGAAIEADININLSDLAIYSAWNTNANAIGLGIANMQVYSICEQTTKNSENFIKKSREMLLQHLTEDGIYTVSGKRLLTNERFYPVYEDTLKSEKLLTVLNTDNILKLFDNKVYKIKDNIYTVKNSSLNEYCLPWGRLFECYLDFNVTIEK